MWFVKICFKLADLDKAAWMFTIYLCNSLNIFRIPTTKTEFSNDFIFHHYRKYRNIILKHAINLTRMVFTQFREVDLCSNNKNKWSKIKWIPRHIANSNNNSMCIAKNTHRKTTLNRSSRIHQTHQIRVMYATAFHHHLISFTEAVVMPNTLWERFPDLERPPNTPVVDVRDLYTVRGRFLQSPFCSSSCFTYRSSRFAIHPGIVSICLNSFSE